MTAAAAPAALPQGLSQPGLSLRQLWAILRDYLRWIVLTVVVVTLLTGIISKLLPKTYEATATVLIDFEVNDPLTGREFPSQLAASYMATQVEFVGSPTTLLPVVDRLDLTRNPKFVAGYSGAADGGLREFAMNSLSSSLTIGQANTSRFIYITAAADDPQMAARIANTVAQVYIDEQLKRATEPARDRATRYGDQLETLRKQVDEAQAKVTEFREKTGLIDLSEKADVDTQRLTELDSRLAEVQSQRREAQQRSIRGGESDGRVLDSGLIQALKSDLSAKEAELAQRSAVLGRRNPDLIALQAEVAAARERLRREVGNYGGNARSDLSSAQRIEAELKAELEQQRNKVLETRRLQDDGARYLRELETATTVYRKALEGYDQILLGSRSHYSSASLASPAAPPLKHSKPKTSINVVLGVFAGGFFGIAGCLLYELLNRRVRCREDVEADLGLPVLVELDAGRKPAFGWRLRRPATAGGA